MSNTLPWPSIEQLPREVCAKIKRHLNVADIAAMNIQRAWRIHKDAPCVETQLANAEAFAGGYSGNLHTNLLKSPVFCSEKLDGTNVGKLRDGTLLGRRQAIEEEATTYLRCSLAPLRALKTDSCLDELTTALCRDEARVVRRALYGELCCNPSLYDYTSRKLSKTWQVFGAMFQFSDSDDALAAAERGTASGFCCRALFSTVLVANTPALRELLQRHGISAVPGEEFPSLCELVAQKKKWMMSEGGEGLVLTVNCGGKPKNYKWKISREPQSAAIKELTELIHGFKPNGSLHHKATLLLPQVHQLLATLHEVATYEDSTFALAASKEKGAAQKSKARQCVLAPEVILTAIASAATKFDAFDAKFAAEGGTAVPALVEMLRQEVLADPDLGLPTDAKELEAGTKEVDALVRRHVGTEFGAWQRGQRQTETAA